MGKNEICCICEGNTVVYLDSTDRPINSIIVQNQKKTICRSCIIKFLLGFIVAANSPHESEARNKAMNTVSTFKSSQLPPGF
jgi:hypothetical protein